MTVIATVDPLNHRTSGLPGGNIVTPTMPAHLGKWLLWPIWFGTEATAEDIAAIDIDVMPDGQGAPPGSGDYRHLTMSGSYTPH